MPLGARRGSTDARYRTAENDHENGNAFLPFSGNQMLAANS
jgi:hypothetical protein